MEIGPGDDCFDQCLLVERPLACRTVANAVRLAHCAGIEIFSQIDTRSMANRDEWHGAAINAADIVRLRQRPAKPALALGRLLATLVRRENQLVTGDWVWLRIGSGHSVWSFRFEVK